MSDDGDLACSQALDNIEEILSLSGEPEPKIPKIDPPPLKQPLNRLTLNPLRLNRFAFVPSKKPPNVINPPPSTSTSNSNETEPAKTSNDIQFVEQPKKNRIFCTPSDEESSQNSETQEKLVRKLPFKLKLTSSKFISQRPILQQQNVNTSKDSDKSENDSAYDSMQLSGSSINAFGSAAKTGKTPPIFPSSGGTHNISGQDLSCLDSVEF